MPKLGKGLLILQMRDKGGAIINLTKKQNRSKLSSPNTSAETASFKNMNLIDHITYTATTSESATASSSVINADMYIPFIDFTFVLLGLSFTILCVWFGYYMLYTKK